MKAFLIDEDLPRSLARALSVAGLRGRSDSVVLADANRNRRTLVTADLDFSSLLQYPLGTHAGIVIARFPNETPVDTLNEAVVAALNSLADDEITGCLVIIEPGRVRLRR